MTTTSMNDDDQPATRGDLRRFEERFEAKLDAKLDAKLGALEAKLDAKLEAKLDVTRFTSEIAQLERRLSAEFARHAGAMMEASRAEMRAMLDPYGELPARVERLEAAVFAPKPRKRRTGRATGRR